MLHVYVILYASTCTFLVHTYIHTDIHIYTQTYIHTYKHMYTQTDIHIYFLQVRKHTHGHTHTQTYTHTLSLSLTHHTLTCTPSLIIFTQSPTCTQAHTHTHTHTCQETEGLGCIPNGTPTTVHVYCHRRHLHPGITANVRRRSSGLSMPPCLHTN